MGSLKRFNLGRIIREFNTKYFFETGTWKGHGVKYAARFSFEGIYSSEIMHEFAENAKERFTHDSRVKIIEGNSIDVFNSTLKSISGNCIFWLDAHFPGADEGLKSYNEYEDEKIRLPLAEEIQLIRDLRKDYQDVILVDDLRIYEEGPYESGNLPSHVLPPRIRNTKFIEESLGATHIIVKSYRAEGYLMAFPKESFLRNNRGAKKMAYGAINPLLKKIY